MMIGLLTCAVLFGAITLAQSQPPAPPKLELVFELHARLDAPIVLGQFAGGTTRRIIPVNGGTFDGRIKGKLQPGGADHQIIHADGFTEVDAQYALVTDQGETIHVRNKGMRHGPPELIARLNAGETVGPMEQSQIYFRTAPVFDTAAPRLQWMTRALFICVGERYPNEVVIRFYLVG